MDNVIFLDLDGVLNIIDGKNPTYKLYIYHFEPFLVKRFNELLETIPNLQIVISSSWREDMDDLKSILISSGFKFIDRIIDSTPLNNDKRGKQIKDFIQIHNINKFLIIDDNIEEIKIFFNESYYIKVNSLTGLSANDIKKIKMFFN